MILRIVLGRFPEGIDADALVDLRARLTRSARAIKGLESLIVGGRRVVEPNSRASPKAKRPAGDRPTSDPGAGDRMIEAMIATVWRDVETMTRAASNEEETWFLASRLDLPFTVERTDHYELVERTFAALPPESTAIVRFITVRARRNEEARLIEMLRDQGRRSVELGLVASHLGRRVLRGGEVEAAIVSVWPDLEIVDRASGGHPERPLFARELTEWDDRLHLEMYDGIELAPRLPTASGPPILILDESLRIVDITSAAAAILGMPATDFVGRRVDELTLGGPVSGRPRWALLLEAGTLAAESAWSVPDIGVVILRFVARRDVPIPGRHAVFVRRHHDQFPTQDDLDDALQEAFPARTATG
jgi:PAS domain-containing protein